MYVSLFTDIPQEDLLSRNLSILYSYFSHLGGRSRSLLSGFSWSHWCEEVRCKTSSSSHSSSDQSPIFDLVLPVLQVTNVIMSVPEARKSDLCFPIKVFPK